jgi:hypothetical protein
LSTLRAASRDPSSSRGAAATVSGSPTETSSRARPVGRADVDVLLGDGRDALVVLVAEVDGRLCDHARHGSVVGVDGDLLSPGDRPVGGPDPREFEEPVVGDIAHGVADLVGVPRHRDGRLDIGFALGDRDGVPVVVDRRLVGARFDGVQPPPLDGGLVS